jgi:glycine dehydrogenase subunit 1
MMASLTGMDVSNASLYDGASALAEAVLMAVRTHKQGHKILLPRTVHPVWRKVVHAIVKNQKIELIEVDYDRQGGHTTIAALDSALSDDCAALVIPQPNFFGVLEDVDALTDWAHARGLIAIACVNPVSLALLKAPGEWGTKGADIAVGDGQPLGVPLSSGGPYFGFMACKQEFVRQMPGRIIGRTVDKDGKPGFTLTLQAREQHIRRSKATSNICTNQGLLVTAATIHMALLGPDGLERVAAQCHANTADLLGRITKIAGMERVFDRPYFHETVVRANMPIADLLRALEPQAILAGYNLTAEYPELGQAMLVCATETRTTADMEKYILHMERVVSRRRLDPPCAQKVST